MPRRVSSSIAATLGLRVARPGGDARLVVVAQHPVRPAARGQGGLIAVDQRRRGRARMPGRRQQSEVKRQVHAAEVAAVVGHQPLDGQVELADQQALGKLVDHAAQPAMIVVDLRPIGAVERQQRRVRRVAVGGSRDWAGCRETASSLIRWRMASTRKPSTPRFEPEAQHVEHRALRTSGLRQLRSGCSLRKA